MFGYEEMLYLQPGNQWHDESLSLMNVSIVGFNIHLFAQTVIKQLMDDQDLTTAEQTDPPSPRSTFSTTHDSPHIKKIIQSTEQIINSQAIKIFELSQQVGKFNKQKKALQEKYNLLLQIKGKDGVNVTENDEKLINCTSGTPEPKQKQIDLLVEKVIVLEGELASIKTELAVSEQKRLVKVAQTQADQYQGIKNRRMQKQQFRQSFLPQRVSTGSRLPINQNSSLLEYFDEIKERNENSEQSESVIENLQNSQIWLQYIQKYITKLKISKLNKFKEKTWELVKKDGIPGDLRKSLWTVIFENSLGLTDSLYSELLTRKDKYKIVQQKVVNQIARDLSRSFNGRIQFQSKVGLVEEVTQILEVFHIFRPDMSYVQGMTYPVIILDLVVGKYKAFTIFCNLTIGNHFLRRLFMFEGEYLTFYCRAFESLLKQSSPKVYKTLNERNIQAEVYLVQWFYTFFSRGMSYQSTLKIWDRLAYEQQLLFFKLGLSIFECLEQTIPEATYEETISIIREFSSYLDQQLLFKTLNGHKLTREKMDKYIEKISSQINT